MSGGDLHVYGTFTRQKFNFSLDPWSAKFPERGNDDYLTS